MQVTDKTWSHKRRSAQDHPEFVMIADNGMGITKHPIAKFILDWHAI